MSETKKAVESSIMTREFDAPKQLVFDAWTKHEHLKNWMFPQPGCTNEYKTVDIRQGGSDHYKMIMPNGFEMWMVTKYEEITEPDKLVFRQYFSNEDGDILPNHSMPNWPQEMTTTITLAETNGKTMLTLSWDPVDPSPEEIETFENSRSDHSNGWNSGFNQLETYLATLT